MRKKDISIISISDIIIRSVDFGVKKGARGQFFDIKL